MYIYIYICVHIHIHIYVYVYKYMHMLAYPHCCNGSTKHDPYHSNTQGSLLLDDLLNTFSHEVPTASFRFWRDVSDEGDLC